MLKLIAVTGFALTVATSAYGMTPAPLARPDDMVTQVAVGCGMGRTRMTVFASHGRPYAMLAAPPAGACAGTAASAPCMSEPGANSSASKRSRSLGKHRRPVRDDRQGNPRGQSREVVSARMISWLRTPRQGCLVPREDFGGGREAASSKARWPVRDDLSTEMDPWPSSWLPK